MTHNVYFVTRQDIIHGLKNVNHEDFIIIIDIHGCAKFEQRIFFYLIED